MPSSEAVRSTSAPVQAVHRTMSALEQLADHPEGVTVLEVSEALQVEKSIASRVLSTLLADGWVVRDRDSDRHRLSLRLMALTTRYSDRLGFPGLCQPILADLSERTGELVQLTAVDGGHLVLTAYAEPRGRGLTVAPRLGTDVSPHATASGQAWLSTLEPDHAATIALGFGLQALTERSVTDVTTLLRVLREADERGYAFAEGEFLDQVNAVAVPVGRARFPVAVGTLAISAPAHRLRRDGLATVIPALHAAEQGLTEVWPTAIALLASNPRH